jgi:urate oxidase
MLKRLAAASASSALALVAYRASDCRSAPDGLTAQRDKEFRLSQHYHGKERVRVLRVQHGEQGRDTVQEFTVQTRLFANMYSKVFTHEDNSDLVATDTQKNTCYVIAKRSQATTPEGYGIDLASHLLNEYKMLEAVEVEVIEDLWRRTKTDGADHDHGFVREGPEQATAFVRLTREQMQKPEVRSGLQGLTVLKTTQSGFEGYHRDSYTLLPETTERCMATQMKVEWGYADGFNGVVDYAAVRAKLRSEVMRGFFGPAKGGVYSVSLQATIYDAGCLVLQAIPAVQRISIYTPNMHMIPFLPLKQLGGDTAAPFADDVYVSTSDPAGTIHCTVSR